MKQAQITLETAKALYAQGGAARQLALDNFSESDLKEPNWPKRYDDLGDVEGCFIDHRSRKWMVSSKTNAEHRNIPPTSADCESILAFCQLRQLAERMNDGWEPSERNRGYTVGYQWPSSTGAGLHSTIASKFYKELIVFKNQEMASFSLKHHKNLWEKYWKV